MSELTEQKVKEYMWEIIKVVDADLELWNEKDLKDFFTEDDNGQFMLVGFMLGRGHTAEQINATVEGPHVLAEIIEDIDFS